MFRSEWHGRQDYLTGEAIQKQRLDDPGVLLGFEFDPVITLGKRGTVANDLATSVEELSGFKVVQVERGGHATLHSQGQLVIYPVLDLLQLRWGVKDYLCWLQRVTKAALREFGIEAFEGPEPGLYTSRGKIAFFGVRIVRGRTQHGVSINVSNDMGEFRHIVSCGVRSERFDRVADHTAANILEFFTVWCEKAKNNAGQGCESLQFSREGDT